MAQNINNLLADKIRVHTLNVLKSTTKTRRKIMAVLDELQVSLVAQLNRNDITLTKFQRKRLEALLANVEESINGAFTSANTILRGELIDLADAEQVWTANTINKAVGAELVTSFMTKQQLENIADGALIQGAPSEEWWNRQSTKLMHDFTDTMRVGMARGETLGQLTTRLRGGRIEGVDGQPGIDLPGVLTGPRRNAEAIVRTSFMQVASDARRDMYGENDDIIKGIMQVSTLDGRTTLVCIAYSGATWDLDFNPIGKNTLPYNGGVPRHWGCRSAETPILKSFEEISGIKGAPKLPPAKRASMDGEVPEDMTFSDWLTKKGESFQNELLGESRAKMWRGGNITLSQLVNADGTPSSVSELKEIAD